MPLTSPVQEFYIKKFLGMNDKIEDNENSIENSVLTQNGRFESEPGALVKRPPISYYNGTTLGTGSVHSTFRWRNASGTSVMNCICGTSMYVGADSTGTMTAIKTGLTEGKKAQSVVYRDIAIFSNGYENPWCSDGSDYLTWELGACKATPLAGGANLDASANYYYAVGIEYQSGVEYICGAVSNTITTGIAGGNRKVTLSQIPLGPVGTISRKIYRTVGGGATLYLIATISDNTTVTYVDDIADTTITPMPAVTDDMPKGALLSLHRERLFIGGDPEQTSRIYYSDPYLPWFIQAVTQLSYMDIFPDEGDEIMGIPIIADVMVCIKRNTIRKVFVQQATSGASPESWYASDIVSYHGSPARYSICQSLYGVIYLGWDHWYLFDGNTSREILDEFDTDGIFSADYRNVSAIFYNGHLYASYTKSETGAQYKDSLLVYNFRRKALNLDDVGVESFATYVGGDDVNEFFYGASSGGFVYYAAAAEKVIKYTTQSSFVGSTYTRAAVAGTEDNPILKLSRTTTIDAFAGTINAATGTIDLESTTGSIVFPSINLNVKTFGRLSWNLNRYHDSDTVTFYVRSGASQAACEAAAWGTGMTNSTGSNIATTPAAWVQIKVEMVANSTAGSPTIIKSDGFLIKMTYAQGGAVAESSVEFIHEMGNRNFDATMVDKIFKKLASNHVGTAGNFTITWTTENATGTFTINLANNPSRWESFFPADAMGRVLNLRIYKDDLEDFKLKELKGIFTPEPVII